MTPSPKDYIDIHTHQIPSGKNIAIENRYPSDDSNFIPEHLYSVGIHPWYIPEKTIDKQLSLLEQRAALPGVIAIGECGLDKNSKTPMDIQRMVFEKHIELSEQFQKPLIIHCVKAFHELVEINKAISPTVSWIIHGFNSQMQIADMLLRHEMSFSLGKGLLDPKSNAIQLLDQLEDEEFLLETDDTDESIEEIYRIAAKITGMDMDILKLSMYTNFMNCFKI